MTAPLTDARLEEIRARHERDTRALDNPVIALATSVAFDSAHADRNDLLAALAQCREEREALRQSRDWWTDRWTNESAALAAAREGKDAAYTERNRCVAALAALFPSSLERHPDSDTAWDDDWRWIVFVDLPTGQASWHLHDSHLPLFAHIPRLQGRTWDGHTTEEKYDRLARALLAGEAPGQREEGA